MSFALRLSCAALLMATLSACGTALVLGTAASVVSGGITTFNDRRDWSVQRQDGDTVKHLRAVFAENPDFANATIQTDCYNQTVLLTGLAQTPQQRALAANIVAAYPGVRRVHNQLQLSSNYAQASADNSENWLATRIRTALAGKYGMDASYVKTIVYGNTVYLMGLLTRTEAANVLAAVRSVDGVDHVVSLVEFVRLLPTPEE